MNRRKLKNILRKQPVWEPSENLLDRLAADIPDSLAKIPSTQRKQGWSARPLLVIAAAATVTVGASLGWWSFSRTDSSFLITSQRPAVKADNHPSGDAAPPIPPATPLPDTQPATRHDETTIQNANGSTDTTLRRFSGGISVTGEAPMIDVTSTVTGITYSVDGLNTMPFGEGLGTWHRSNLAPNSSRLTIGEDDDLPLLSAAARVRIDGFRARVVLELVYLNDHDRQFEGTFQLRLPDGASPFYLSFGNQEANDTTAIVHPQKNAPDEALTPENISRRNQALWSSIKEARMVPRREGAKAYTDTVNRAVDPALVEWAGSGVFQARVFPLLPHRIHPIVIGYDVDLVDIGDDLELRFDLPTHAEKRYADISVLELENSKTIVSPRVDGSSSNGRTRFLFSGPDLTSVLVRLKDPGAILLVGHDEDIGPLFAGRVLADLPNQRVRSEARTAVFVVDVSLSSNPDNFNIWLDMMEAILHDNRDILERFAVLFFNIETFWWKPVFVTNTPDNVARLMVAANGLALEGATDITSALTEAVDPTGLDFEALSEVGQWSIFLLSDGAATWGPEPAFPGLDQHHPVFAYSTGMEGGDSAVLDRITQASGGARFSVTGAGEVESAAVAHRTRPWLLASAEVDDCSDILIKGRPGALYPDQAVTVAGRGKPSRTATLRFGIRASKRSRLRQSELVFRHIVESDLAARIYGQVATNHLEDLSGSDSEVTRAYAKHFHVTGRSCSLVMLETVRDYASFGFTEEDLSPIITENPVASAITIPGSETGPNELFLEWLDRTQIVIGEKFQLLPGFQQAILQLPESSFIVKPEILDCRIRRRRQLSDSHRHLLSDGRLDSALVHSETERLVIEELPSDALKVVSSLIEQHPGNLTMLRDVAGAGAGWGFGGHAFHLLRRLVDARPGDLDAPLALAEALAQTGSTDLAVLYFEVLLAAFWDYDDAQPFASAYLDLLRRIDRGEAATSVPSNILHDRASIEQHFDLAPADLMIRLSWTTDNTDIDLHVVEPSGEECSYQNPRTTSGGTISEDVTEGFGPELYLQRNTSPGTYRVFVTYFDDDANRSSTRTRVYAELIRNWGRPTELVIRKAVTLSAVDEQAPLFEVIVGE